MNNAVFKQVSKEISEKIWSRWDLSMRVYEDTLEVHCRERAEKSVTKAMAPIIARAAENGLRVVVLPLF